MYMLVNHRLCSFVCGTLQVRVIIIYSDTDTDTSTIMYLDT